MTTTIDTAAPDGFAIVAGSHHRYLPGAWSRGSYHLTPSPTLRVVVEHVGDMTVVREVAVGIYGVGPNIWDAWKDFRAAVQQHLDVLERQEALSDALAGQLAYLHARLRQ